MGPLLELYKTKKFFVVLMQLCAAVLMALAGLALRLPVWLAITFGAMMVCAFVGATIDIGTDGVYVTTLDDKQKAKWAGIQSMAWTGGQFLALSALVWVAGKLHDDYGYTWQIAWMYVFLAAAVILVGLAAWHGAFMPPGAKAKDAPKSMGEAMAGFAHAYKTFFQKKLIWRMLALAFFYRFGWYLIEKVNNIFLIADRAEGGLGLTNQAAGQISGGWGSVSFLAASVVGGLVLAKVGLSRKTLMFFVGSLVIPNLAFMCLGRSQPDAFLAHHGRLVRGHVRLRLRRRRAHVLHDEADLAGAVPDRALRLRYWDHGPLQFLSLASSAASSRMRSATRPSSPSCSSARFRACWPRGSLPSFTAWARRPRPLPPSRSPPTRRAHRLTEGPLRRVAGPSCKVVDGGRCGRGPSRDVRKNAQPLRRAARHEHNRLKGNSATVTSDVNG